jgi:flagellum-specific ATP synthase
MGAYIAGTDPELDDALKAWPKIQDFLRQESEVAIPLLKTLEILLKITPGK